MIEVGASLRARDHRRGCNPREGQRLGVARSFFDGVKFVNDEAFRYQEPIGCDAQRGMVVKAQPTPALVVTRAEILVVALNAPTLMDDADKFAQGGILE